MRVTRFFDRLEDRARRWFSHWPILYGVVGGVGVVLFWRGVWHTADFFSAFVFTLDGQLSTTDFPQIWDGLTSFLIGFVLLLATGLFVSNFIGNEIIISGLRGEKKLAEKTEVEVRTETGALAEIKEELKGIRKRLSAIEDKLTK
ncbi:MAG: hypothetical protein A3A43_00685 [Candidatus Liptonbacteria bacterium RIFCSPLOWO2_01_FULL_56_20]|uniref:Uncharacterized protein n=1 Tax=Candidatus Liptonbacteria bacterium RIFCSPLOWO2_01_FULL_56_20 TaxID=1798652 RepID=A0A1G2CHJ7_9BACT|nr:MAG: hypothetical protein A3A43_00685 [Candidatus Liptonbacteria bacterium RIFCSPLOWO2_01_FULL_56_20]